MDALLLELGSPQEGLPCVHIAGTNGKGSTAAFLERMLREAGYRTGLFTSPHLVRFHERIQVAGEPIGEAALQEARARVDACKAKLGIALNYFQEATALAFLHFQQMGCEIVLLECGLGGRLDPTNAIRAPLLCMLTRIGMDHEYFLGNTIEAIAGEKAGIIKPGVEVLLLAQQPEVERVVRAACVDCGAKLHPPVQPLTATANRNGLVLHTPYGDIAPGIGGAYQAENAALALAALPILARAGFLVPDAQVRAGIQTARWPARFECVCKDPPVVFDGAHNPQGAAALLHSIAVCFPGRQAVFVMGSMQDKEYEKSVQAVAPLALGMIAVPIDSARALPPGVLQAAMARHCATAYAASSMEDALSLAQRIKLQHHAPDAVICVFGSLYLAEPVQQAVKVCFA